MLKDLSRGKKVTKESLKEFIANLSINEEDKERLLKLTPQNYTGLSEEIINNN